MGDSGKTGNVVLLMVSVGPFVSQYGGVQLYCKIVPFVVKINPREPFSCVTLV